MKTIFGLLMVLLFAECLCEAAEPQLDGIPTGRDSPNFVFIYCDNLGYGDVSPFWEGTPHRTPQLERMAAEGTKFTHFYVSSGVCTPSRATAMTGCYAQRVGLAEMDPDVHVLRPVSPNGLHPDEITVAEVLKEQGYATTIIGKWHLGDQLPFLPTRQGFDSFFGIPYSDDMTGGKQEGWPPLPLMENEKVIEAPVVRDGLTKRYTERAVKYIEENTRSAGSGQASRPFFLYLPQAMPGSTPEPFASEAFRGKSANGPWGDSVEELDWSTGQILDAVEAAGIAERTLVIWTSDNGAPIKSATDISRGSNRPLFGRGYTTAEGGFRVPMIAWWPGTIPAGAVNAEMCATMDLLPTVAALAGGKAPGDRIIDGKDIRPLLLGEVGATSPHEAYYYYHRNQLQAVRSGPWKLFVPLENVARHPRAKNAKETTIPAMLFNVVEDIGTEKDVAAGHPDVVARLMAYAEAAREDLGDTGRPGKGVRPAGRFENPTARVLE